ncbi:MAG: AAA family ATPase [bacterium]|nr:AAA family ATPase [bacterium]
MEIANLQHGKILTLDVVPLVDVGIERIPPNGRELMLTRVGDLCALILPGQAEPLVVDARDHKSRRELQRSIEQDAPRLCWLVGLRSDRNQLVALTIQIHEFSERFSIPELKIGVDEKLVADMGRQQARRFSTETACAWLADKLIIQPNSPAGLARVIIIGRPDSQHSQKQAFRILGDRFALDVERHKEGGWLAFRLTRPKTAIKPEEYRPVILAEGAFEFVDQTIAGKMRQGMATELDQIVRTAGSYLGVWLEYQAMEHRRVVEEAKRFGWLSYDGCHRMPDGCWSFQLTADSQWTPSQLWQGITADKDLEASAEVPDMLTSTPAGDEETPSFQIAVRESRPAFRGALAGNDTQSIRLRPDTQDGVVPPDRGYIHVSLRGDLKRMARRNEAHSRIASGKTSIPQLALLLENRPVPVRRVQTHEPLSGAAKARFHSGAPTPRQVEAIRVALNTPDIAVIQGPPGTGKTRTISAIIERLTEIAKDQNADFEKVLLTSFQHDAVENAAAMTEIFGLPAMKVGRRRGDNSESLPLIAWTNRIAEALEADLAASPKKPLRKLLETIRIRHASYVKSPGTETEAARMLLDLRSLAGEHLPADLSDRIVSVADRLKLGVAGQDDECQAAIQVVRGLRIQKEAFADDGPKMAWRVLNQLSSGSWLTAEDRALLEKARDWDSESAPDFLPAMELVKNRLLDALQLSTPPSRTPLVNSEVINVLDEMISTLDKCVRNASAEGAGYGARTTDSGPAK